MFSSGDIFPFTVYIQVESNCNSWIIVEISLVSYPLGVLVHGLCHMNLEIRDFYKVLRPLHWSCPKDSHEFLTKYSIANGSSNKIHFGENIYPTKEWLDKTLILSRVIMLYTQWFQVFLLLFLLIYSSIWQLRGWIIHVNFFNLLQNVKME